MSLKEAVVYTDGGCKTPNGPGAWAYRIEHPDGKVVERSGPDSVTTNNRMEMMAAVMAMEALPAGAKALFTTDSQYLQQGFTTWYKGWMAAGWKTADGKDVKNLDLWKRMFKAKQGKVIRMTWVKGHANNAGNARVDSLCLQEMRKLIGKQSNTERRSTPFPKCPDCTLPLS